MPHTGLNEVKDGWQRAAKGKNPRKAISNHRPDYYDQSGRDVALEFQLLCPKAKVVMDFGCGDGRVTQHLASLFPEVIAVDIVPEMLQMVKKRALGNVHCFESNGADLVNFGPDVDAIVSDSVLLHNRKDDVRKIFRGFAHCLEKKRGLLAVQLPVYEEGPSHDPDNWTDVGVWTPEEFYDLASDTGFFAKWVWVNPKSFSFKDVGPYHGRLHVLRQA